MRGAAHNQLVEYPKLVDPNSRNYVPPADEPAPVSLVASGIVKTLDSGQSTIRVLSELELEVDAGSSCAIVGSSGSGKTTLLSILAGMDHADQGSVTLSAGAWQASLLSLDEDQRALLRGQMMGFVFQNFQLIADMSALDNVMLPLELSGNSAREQALYWLDRVGLAGRAGHYPRQLSGGEQQRVALARAFVNQPRLLFADEPTGSLDERTAEEMVELLFQLVGDHAVTLVLVTHDLPLAERCDHAFQLRNGVLQPMVGGHLSDS